MKLWAVHGTVEVDIVMATEGDDPPDELNMQECVNEEFMDNVSQSAWWVSAGEIGDERGLPHGWDVHCEAYGSVNEDIGWILDTIAQERKAREDAEKNERDQVKLFDV